MALFQHSVLNKYLSGIDEEKVNKAWEAFTAHFHNAEVQQNIRNSKEEAYQEGFLDDLFVKVLGYAKNPSPEYNLMVEQKNLTDSKKADGALLDGDKVRGVIELKGTETTDLSKVEPQAFGYKNKQPDARYVIISNFEKLRFYIDNAVDFLEFNLFKLTKEEFKVLWLCLGYPNFANNLPKKIKDASLTEEENVTKKLYKDYSNFKHTVFANITENNPEHDKLLLFKKTQKLLDRFLFIFFAEDRLLLPPNSIREIINQWMDLRDEYDAYVPLYDRFKKYFGYMNGGHKGSKHEIFAYNGGLFAADNVLDSLTIDDELLYKHTLELSKYDFESEVDVNILGHIFEHSLNEIEAINAELKGEEVDTTKSRRKKDGVFYTPKYITKYIVEHTVGKLCDEKKAELDIDDEEYRPNRQKKTKKGLLDKLEHYRQWLLELTICDPACGSGAFLNQTLEFLITEHTYIDELQAKLLDESMVIPDIENQILEHNLFGVDINEESVDIAKLSLWLRTAEKGRKLTSLNDNIKCGNSLIDDPEVAGEKAFIWEEEFPDIFTPKAKQAYHVTCVTHNSRTSKRRKQFNVKKGDPFILDDELEVFVTRTIADIVKEDALNVLAYNICADHLHMILVCEPDELPNIVRKLKGKSAQKLKEHLKVPKEEKFHLWAQKFNRNLIEDDDQMHNTWNYIVHNRKKHELPPNKGLEDADEGLPGGTDDKGSQPTHTSDATGYNKGLQPLVVGSTGERGFGYFGMCCSYAYAFRPEYTGGFDVVIGNPPYGAKLSKKIQKYLNETYVKGGSETAISFIKLSFYLLKNGGKLSFIIPKSFSYASNYSAIRNFILKDIEEIVDCGKVWKEVKLEQVIFSLKKDSTLRDYKSSLLVDKTILKVGDIEKDSLKKFGLFLNGISDLEKSLGNKIWSSKFRIKDIADNSRGGTFQRHISDKGELTALGGAEIQRHGVVGVKGMVDKEKIKNEQKAFIQSNSVLVQNIVSHIKNPIDHIKITACLPDKSHYVIVDTINQITVSKGFDNKIIWYLLNSKLINWYAYRFIFGKAIRTMHFDNGVTDRIPIPEISNKNQELLHKPLSLKIKYEKQLEKLRRKFLNLLQSKFEIPKLSRKLQSWHELSFKQFLKELKVKKVKLSLEEEAEWMDYFNEQKGKAGELKTQINQTDQEIDAMVYELYGLNEQEIKVVEAGA